MKPAGHAASGMAAAVIAISGLSALPTKAAADNLSSFAAGVVAGALLGGHATPYQAPRPNYYHAPQPETRSYAPPTSYYVQPPAPGYVYVAPGYPGSSDDGGDD